MPRGSKSDNALRFLPMRFPERNLVEPYRVASRMGAKQIQTGSTGSQIGCEDPSDVQYN